MLGSVLDVFRLRQYFDVAARTRELFGGARDDVGFANDVRRALVPLPSDAWPSPRSPFPRVGRAAPGPHRRRGWRCARQVAVAHWRRSSALRARSRTAGCSRR